MTSTARSVASRLEPYAWFFATYEARTRKEGDLPPDWRRPGPGTDEFVPGKRVADSFYRGMLLALGLAEEGSGREAWDSDKPQLWVKYDDLGDVDAKTTKYPSAFVLAYRVNRSDSHDGSRWVLVVAKRETCPAAHADSLEGMTRWLRRARKKAQSKSERNAVCRTKKEVETEDVMSALDGIADTFFDGCPVRIGTAKQRLQTIAVWPRARLADACPALLDAAIDLTARDPAPSTGLTPARRQKLREKHGVHWWEDWALVVHRENTGFVCTTKVAKSRIDSIDGQYVLVHAWCALVQAALVELMGRAVALGPPPDDRSGDCRAKRRWEEWEDKAAALRADVGAFRNRLWFPEITFNSALRCYHHILVDEFALRGLYADVADEIEMLDEDAQRRLNNTVNRLSKKGFPLLLAASILGMNVVVDPLRNAFGGRTVALDLVIFGLAWLGAWGLVKCWLRRRGTPMLCCLRGLLGPGGRDNRAVRSSAPRANHQATRDIESGD